MGKRLVAVIMALMLLAPAALAEMYRGKAVATEYIAVESGAGGILESLTAQEGAVVAPGENLGRLRTQKVFAAQDGTVARINAGEGDAVDGAVMELLPVERYQVYCTVDKAYQPADATLVHSGERVYIKCTANGTHRGEGLITAIDGAEYRVLALGGELYVGETVYLYRDADFSSDQRVGIGTVVTSDPQAYESSGTLAKLHVSQGEYVERGELLYEILDGKDGEITAPSAGIVARVCVSQGDAVIKDQVVAEIVPPDGICVEFMADETVAANIRVGDEAVIVLVADPLETEHAGVVTEVSRIAQEGMYAVRVMPCEADLLCLGMSADVRLDDK